MPAPGPFRLSRPRDLTRRPGQPQSATAEGAPAGQHESAPAGHRGNKWGLEHPFVSVIMNAAPSAAPARSEMRRRPWWTDPPAQRLAPTRTGSLTSSTPNVSRTPFLISLASASSDAVVAPPGLTSASVCLVEIRAPDIP